MARILKEIANDRLHGAHWLTLQAAEALRLLAAKAEGAGFEEQLLAMAQLLAAAQPRMASLLNLTNAVLLAAEKSAGKAGLTEAVSEAAYAFAGGMEKHAEKAAVRFSSCLKKRSVILTHSSSDSVKQALAYAWRRKRLERVIVTESRPLFEGRRLAVELGRDGIPVTIIADAAMLDALRAADAALVGADAVTVEGVVNKTGTALLALAARVCRKPFYVLCGSEKLLAAGLKLADEPARDPRELLPQVARGVTVMNRYFDLTPLEWLTAVITEDGMLAPAELKKSLRRLRVHPALLSTQR